MARNRKRAKERKRKASAPGAGPAPGPVPGVVPGTPGVAPVDATPRPDDPAPSDAALLAAQQSPESIPAEALEQPEPPARKSGPRFLQFLKACWAELQRVQWPDRPQVIQATAVVLGFCVIAGAYLGIADFGAKNLIELIL